MNPAEYIEHCSKKSEVSNHDLELMRRDAQESARWANRISLFLGLLTVLLLYIIKALMDRDMWGAVALAAAVLLVTVTMGTKAHTIAGNMGHLSGRAESLQQS